MEIMKRNPNPINTFRQMGVNLQKYLRLILSNVQNQPIAKGPFITT
jgi:hypothetical protein